MAKRTKVALGEGKSAEPNEPSNQGRVLALLKIGHKEHMEGLAKGQLYCRSLAYYRRLENRLDPRTDQDEGLAGVLQKDRVQLSFSSALHPEPHIINAASGLAGPVVLRRNISAPVLCLYAIHSGGWPDPFTERQFEDEIRPGLQPDTRMNEFGEYVWLILNGETFRERLTAACQRRRLGAEGRLVKYIDRSIVHGHVSGDDVGFTKFARFAWQREYRYMFDMSWPAERPFILDVGPLQDISVVMPLSAFRAGLSYRLGPPVGDAPPAAPA